MAADTKELAPKLWTNFNLLLLGGHKVFAASKSSAGRNVNGDQHMDNPSDDDEMTADLPVVSQQEVLLTIVRSYKTSVRILE